MMQHRRGFSLLQTMLYMLITSMLLIGCMRFCASVLARISGLQQKVHKNMQWTIAMDALMHDIEATSSSCACNFAQGQLSLIHQDTSIIWFVRNGRLYRRSMGQLGGASTCLVAQDVEVYQVNMKQQKEQIVVTCRLQNKKQCMQRIGIIPI